MAAPSDANRNCIRVQVTLLPAELAELDAIAGTLARPGHKANRSAAVRDMARFLLNAQALGLVEMGPDGIRSPPDRTPRRVRP